MAYPDKIVIEGDLLEDFLKMSEFFKALDRWEGHKPSYTLTAENLFDNDKNAWHLFVNLFFPEMAPDLRKDPNGVYRMDRVFTYLPDGTFGLNEKVYIREYVYGLFDFLMIEEDIWPQVMKYLANVHFVHQGKPAPPSPPVPKIRTPYLRSGYNANLALTPNRNENNENSNSENNLELGFQNSNEEEAYGRMSTKNRLKVAKYGGKKKTRKAKRKTA